MCKENEIVPVPGFEGYYISIDGAVYSNKIPGRLCRLTVWYKKGKYPAVTLSHNGRTYNRSIALLIRMAFPGAIIDSKTLNISGYYKEWEGSSQKENIVPPPVRPLPEPRIEKKPEVKPTVDMAQVSTLMAEFFTKLSQVLQPSANSAQ